MTIKDLQIPHRARRKRTKPGPGWFGSDSSDKPPKPEVAMLEFEGDKVGEFVNEVLARNPHFKPEDLVELRGAKKITGVQKPDKSLGKLIGAMHGRFWYIA